MCRRLKQYTKMMAYVSMYKTRIADYRFTLTLCLLLLISSFLIGCATGPKEEAGPVFYPPLPNPPRIQYLHTFANEYDLGESGGSFGKFLLGEEDNASPIIKPYGGAIRNGKIYVLDALGKAYIVFDLDKKKLNYVTGSGGGGMSKPINMFVDEYDNKYIADTKNRQVMMFNAQDSFVRAYGVEGQFKPTDVALDGDRLYVCDIEHHTVHVLDKNTGKTITKIASGGDDDDEVFKPTNIDIRDGLLYVTDTFNARIQVYTLDEGKHVRSIGRMGTGLGQFARPKGVAVDKEGRVFAVDAAFQNVQIFNRDGRLLLFFGSPGRDLDSINLPSTVFIDYDHVDYFKPYADPKFKIEYLILVVSQYSRNKLNVYGFGKMEGLSLIHI